MWNNELFRSRNKDLIALGIYSLIIGVTDGKLGSFGVTSKIVSYKMKKDEKVSKWMWYLYMG